MLKKWQLLGQVYPDYYAASYNYAYFVWHLQNRASEGIKAIQPALSEHDPQRAGAYYTLAFLQAAENQFDAAEKNFRMAEASGSPAQGGNHAAAYAAQRRFSDAAKMLDQARFTGMPGTDIYLRTQRAAFDVDQGNWQQAADRISSGAGEAAASGKFYSRIHRARQLSLDDYLVPKAEQIAALKSFIAEARGAIENKADANHSDDVFLMLFGAYLAARAGDLSMAKTTLDVTLPQAHGSGYSNIEHMLVIVEAEIAWRSGRAGDAVLLLEPMRDGSELYLTHVAKADAYSAAGRTEDALTEATWLAGHRGRAYMETNSLHMLQARYVAESDLALLRVAELNAKLGRREQSDKALHEFFLVWPQAQQLSFVAPRLAALAKP